MNDALMFPTFFFVLSLVFTKNPFVRKYKDHFITNTKNKTFLTYMYTYHVYVGYQIPVSLCAEM